MVTSLFAVVCISIVHPFTPTPAHSHSFNVNMYQAFYLQMQYAMIPNDDDDMCSANDRQQIIRPLS